MPSSVTQPRAPRHLPLALAATLAAACGGGGGGGDVVVPVLPPAAALRLAQTGQTESRDASAVRRDDGALRLGVAWPSPRFTDHGDGTVTDRLTGLMWLRDADCMQTHAPGFDVDGTPGDGAVTWQHALQFVSSLPGSSCGGSYADWRLPNVRELRSLLDHSRPFLLLPVGHPFQGVRADYYWTSTTDPATDGKLLVNPDDGLHGLSIASNTGCVWPVRAGSTAAPAAVPRTGQVAIAYPGDDGDYARGVGVAWPSPRFGAMADGSVRDHLTGLRWAPSGNLLPTRDAGWDQDGTADDGQVTWQHALDYVARLCAQRYLGHDDWRLPNLLELDSLEHFGYARETCGAGPCGSSDAWLASQGLADAHAGGASWSSTSWAADPWTYAWAGHSYAPKASAHRYVWPVRGPE